MGPESAAPRGRGPVSLAVLALTLAVVSPALGQPAPANRAPRGAVPPAAPAPPHTPPAPAASRPQDALVRVAVHASPPDPWSPWQRRAAEPTGGSGVILEGGRILTNAHVVTHAVVVEVQREGSARSASARVAHVDHTADLALLEVDDPRFSEGVVSPALGPLPELRDRVQVYGYPVGGNALSVTEGVVSRIEVGPYEHSHEELLLVQVDAPINFGNSGGPVLAGARLAGIASQVMLEAENVGYIIPTPVIRHFLDDVADGRVDGFPALGAEVQPADHPALRAALALPPGRTGALVTRINFGSPADGSLRPGDVLLALGGVELAEDLRVSLRPGLRVDFRHLVRARQVGETVEATVWREGGPLAVPVTLRPWTPLVSGHRYPAQPPWLCYGGLVFQPLSIELLEAFEEAWGSAPPGLARFELEDNLVSAGRQQVVVLTQVLKHPVNAGYEWAQGLVLASVDDTRVADLAHLGRLLASAAARPGGRVELRTADDGRLVLDAAAVTAAMPAIRAAYGLPADRSPGPTGSGR